MNCITLAVGSLRYQDASLHVWNEHVDNHIEQVFEAIRPVLSREGWDLQLDPRVKEHYPSIAKNFYYGRKGHLELHLEICGRHIELGCFQNVANVVNPNGGRHDFDKLSKMPYLLSKQTELTLRKVERMLLQEFGYAAASRDLPRPGINGSTALEYAMHAIRNSGHYKETLGRADWHADHNRRSGDGVLLEHGQPVYFRDRKGRWLYGQAYYSLNSSWYVVRDKYWLTQESCWSLFANKPDDLRKKDVSGLSVKRLNQLIEKAVKNRNFMRAHQLQQILDQRFPQALAT